VPLFFAFIGDADLGIATIEVSGKRVIFLPNLRLGLKIINAGDKPIFVAYRFIFFCLNKFFKQA
jgi:hypothetical protein